MVGHHKRIRPVIEDAAPFKIDGVYCRLIPLTRGMYAIVDAADYIGLMQHKWNALWAPNTKSFYAVRTVGVRATGRTCVRMHRQILGLLDCGREVIGDHENGVTLDNRRANLRPADECESVHNRGIFKSNTSGAKGVTWHKLIKMWQVRIGVDGKRLHLGYTDDFEDGCGIYKRAAAKYHGEFTRTESLLDTPAGVA